MNDDNIRDAAVALKLLIASRLHRTTDREEKEAIRRANQLINDAMFELNIDLYP